jgi:ribosome-binding factor A
MVPDKRAREQMLAHCGEIHEDDGVDPRTYFKLNSRRRKKENHKAKQICRQVEETLDQVLSGETRDDMLRNLRVATVVPAPDSSRLLITLYADVAAEEFDREVVEQKLASHSGRLRCEVARAVTRRKTPALVFRVIGPGPRAVNDRREDA